MEVALYWLGVAVAATGSVGLLGALFVWSANQILEAAGFAKEIVHWYGEKLIKKRDAKRILG